MVTASANAACNMVISISFYPHDLKLVFDLFRAMEGTEKAPKEWIGGLNATYYIGGGRKPDGGGLVRLKIVNFNEAKTSTIYNVVAAIPGSIESDR